MVDSPTLIRINWKFGTICNLACRMCQPTVSSHFNKVLSASNHIDNLKKFQISVSNETIKTNPNDLEKLKLLLPNLQVLQTSGGEPFLSDDLDKLLKTAIKTKDCEHIDLIITTNGTKFIKEKLDVISKFRKITLLISIDGTDDVYNYIRYPFSFKILNRRLQYLKKYIQERQLENKIEIQFNPMGMLYNLFNYAKLQKLYNELLPFSGGFNIDFDLTGFFTLNNKNHHYHILHLKFAPELLIGQALDFYQNYQETRWYKDLEYIYNQKQDNSYHSLIKEYTDIFDDMYGQKYYNHLPLEIIKFLNE
jgi:organic radical activating enzyme